MAASLNICTSVQFEPCDTISLLYPVMYGIVRSDTMLIANQAKQESNWLEALLKYASQSL